MNTNYVKQIFEKFEPHDLSRAARHDDCCPDQDWGLVRELKVFKKIKNFNKSDKRRPVNNRGDDEVRLIVVLESPHIDEFFERAAEKLDSSEFGPAMGFTGGNLIKCLGQGCLSNRHWFPKGSNIKLIVMNAVQYQCSRGVKTKECRDDVFCGIWNAAGGSGCGDSGEKDFKERFNKIYAPGDFVWNCCTKGNARVALRELVRRAIYENGAVKSYYAFHHPSSPAWSKPTLLNPYSSKINQVS